MLDEEVGAARRLFAAGDVAGHLFLLRRVDSVLLGTAGWGILLFELVRVRLAPFREGARTGELCEGGSGLTLYNLRQ